MPAEHEIIVMLERVRPLLGEHPDIMRDYLFYRSELEFQRHMLDAAEEKALERFDRLLRKYQDWIVREVYEPDCLEEARYQFDRDHWWWYIDSPDESDQTK